MADFPQQSAFDDLLLRINDVRCAFALRANLHHTLEFARHIEHRLAFDHIHADRLLAINIRARFHRRNRMERVPVIRRPYEHDVELVLFEHHAIVPVPFGRFL